MYLDTLSVRTRYKADFSVIKLDWEATTVIYGKTGLVKATDKINKVCPEPVSNSVLIMPAEGTYKVTHAQDNAVFVVDEGGVGYSNGKQLGVGPLDNGGAYRWVADFR